MSFTDTFKCKSRLYSQISLQCPQQEEILQGFLDKRRNLVFTYRKWAAPENVGCSQRYKVYGAHSSIFLPYKCSDYSSLQDSVSVRSKLNDYVNTTAFTLRNDFSSSIFKDFKHPFEKSD